MDGADEYALTEAEVLDTLQFVVAAEQRAATAMDDDGDDGNNDSKSSVAAAPPYQNRQKLELEYLKTKMRELELELRRLERENDDKLALVGDSTWQRIAQQQFVEKQKSLSENARLKDELEGQIKFAKSLERVIRKRPNLTAFGDGTSDGAPHKTRRSRKNRASAANLYDELCETADREFQRTDEVLAASGLAQVFRDHRSIGVNVVDEDDVSNASSSGGAFVNQALGDLRVDWRMARRYPFAFQSVAKELWKLLSYNSVTNYVANMDRTVERTDDTLFATTSLRVLVGQRDCVLTASAVIRQYIEEDSVTVVWVSDGECEPSKSAKDTFKLYEVGWMQAIPGDPTSSISYTLGYYYPSFSARARGSPSSSSSENEGSPIDTSAASQEAEDIGLLTELLASVYEKSASQMHIAIENALMAEAVGHNKATDE